MRIVYLTAGAAGMYCGSCLHDNALAKALRRRGHDALLVPVYTPILTDQPNASENRLFFGGLNVYLQQISPLFRRLPTWIDAGLSSPKLVGWIASRTMGTTAEKLGALTVSMLQGEHGRQHKEVRRLCHWLEPLEPEVIMFSNLLIAGSISAIRRQLPRTRLVVMLQGDDVFYNGLIQPYRDRALGELRQLAGQVDLFLAHSADYQRRMSQLLEVPDEKIRVCPLSIDADDLLSLDRSVIRTRAPAIGYLARLAPEKGLHQLVEAFIQLKRQPAYAAVRLEIAGWLGKQHADYWRSQQAELTAAGLDGHYHYWGSIDRQAKRDFLTAIDLLAVPTTYPEPKGLFALEAMAAGVPYLLPASGAFPELHQRAGAGRLHQPDSVADLTEQLRGLLDDLDGTRQLGQRCRDYVRQQATADHEAAAVEQALSKL